MTSEPDPNQRRIAPTIAAADHERGHDLIAIDAWLAGSRPTVAEIELTDGPEYRSRYWRCRACGAERARPDDFEAVCPGGRPAPVATDGGHSIEDPRAQRALAADLSVRWVRFGPGYLVEDGDGSTFAVNVETETCRCDDHRETGLYCAHLRRADLAIRSGELPDPDGRFVR